MNTVKNYLNIRNQNSVSTESLYIARSRNWYTVIMWNAPWLCFDLWLGDCNTQHAITVTPCLISNNQWKQNIAKKIKNQKCFFFLSFVHWKIKIPCMYAPQCSFANPPRQSWAPQTEWERAHLVWTHGDTFGEWPTKKGHQRYVRKRSMN